MVALYPCQMLVGNKQTKPTRHTCEFVPLEVTVYDWPLELPEAPELEFFEGMMKC